MPNEKRLVRRAKKNKPIRQVAAVPVRLAGDGSVEVLLVTSNTTRRFIVPKGWPMKGKSARGAALEEARQEAGVAGVAARKPAGAYSYWKRLSDGFVKVDVKVFLLVVSEMLADWQESRSRRRAWLSPQEAAALIDEPELASLVASLKPASLGAAKTGPASGRDA
ncbi:MAG: NUDIX hydrolase [Hyphomicrobiales bacterium]|nr:NUDIX hydrolase [Hyphomicrobiales bacterium]